MIRHLDGTSTPFIPIHHLTFSVLNISRSWRHGLFYIFSPPFFHNPNFLGFPFLDLPIMRSASFINLSSPLENPHKSNSSVSVLYTSATSLPHSHPSSLVQFSRANRYIYPLPRPVVPFQSTLKRRYRIPDNYVCSASNSHSLNNFFIHRNNIKELSQSGRAHLQMEPMKNIPHSRVTRVRIEGLENSLFQNINQTPQIYLPPSPPP